MYFQWSNNAVYRSSGYKNRLIRIRSEAKKIKERNKKEEVIVKGEGYKKE